MLKIGDIVKLKSGGPEMTVIQVNKNWIATQWFLEGIELKDGRFPEDALIQVQK